MSSHLHADHQESAHDRWKPSSRIWFWLANTTAAVVLVVLVVMDESIYQAMSGRQLPLLNKFTELISHLRGATFAYLVSLIALGGGIILGRDKLKRTGLVMLLAVSISIGVVVICKPIIGRPGPNGFRQRPPEASWIAKQWGRFPSGHTATTFSAVAGLAAAFPPTAPIGFAVGSMVAYERVYRGIHYPSDCFAGAWLGLLAARFATRRIQPRVPSST